MYNIIKACYLTLICIFSLHSYSQCPGQTSFPYNYSENYAPSGYHMYPALRFTPSTTTVTVNCNPAARPNRFRLISPSGTSVSSGWLGEASYPGPWGSSLSFTPATNINLTYNCGGCWTLEVEAGPADPNPSNAISDNFSASITVSGSTPSSSPSSPTSTSASPTNVCSGSTSNLSGNCALGVIRWYNSPVGTGAGLSDPLTVNNNQTIYARCFVASNPSDCRYSSASAGINLTEANAPSAPSSRSASVTSGCSGYSSNLSGSCSSGTLRWFNSNSSTATVLSDPLIVNSNQTIYARCFNASNPPTCRYSSPSTGITLSVTNAPGTPGTISGSTPICSSAQTYSISAVSGATSYNWTYSGGGTPSGTGTSITFTPTSSGTLSVTATNSCGTSSARTRAITVNNSPATPGTVSGSSPVCSSSQTYSITPVSGATSYTWTYSGGGTPSGTGTSITFTPTSSGTLSVTATNICGTSAARTRAITVNNTPATPGIINGSSPVCSSSQTYSITPVSGATSYAWTYSGGGTPSGTGTSTTFTPTSSGTLSVTATNTCGTSSARTRSITVDNTPATPGTINGSSPVCSSSQTYSITPLSGATSYAWTYSGGGTPSGTGTSTTFTPTSSGTLSVTATNICGTSAARTRAITVNNTPATPGAIAGATPICQSSQTYSTPAVSGATSYTWTYSGGGTPSGTGTSTTFTPTSSGTLSVTATNTCGTSSARNLAITVSNPPSTPTAISSTVSSGCPGFTTTLTGSCSTGAIRWYNNVTGTGAGLPNPLTVNTTQTVYARCFNTSNPSGCQYGSTSNGIVLNAVDNTPPVISCNSLTIYLNNSGLVSIDTSGLINTLSDNCGIDSVWLNQTDTSFNCMDIGMYTYTLYASDLNGNIDSCSNTLIITDTISPIANCTDTTLYLGSNGILTIDSSFINNNSTANCNDLSFNISKQTFTCADTGVNNIQVIVTSSSGYSDTCFANITILDTLNPLLVCPNDIDEQTNTDCDFTIPNYTLLATTNDNCFNSDISYTQIPPAGSSINTNLGDGLTYTQSIKIIASDASDNSDSCTFNLTINCTPKLIIPKIITPNGDGYNDTWVFKSLSFYPQTSVKVYNRWGALVYQNENYDNTWGGEQNKTRSLTVLSNGKLLPTGNYFYEVQLLDDLKPKTGYVIIRK